MPNRCTVYAKQMHNRDANKIFTKTDAHIRCITDAKQMLNICTTDAKTHAKQMLNKENSVCISIQ